MRLPKMIIFDYGHTLLYTPGWNSRKGSEALMKYVTKNPYNCTVDDVVKGSELIFSHHVENVRKLDYDITAAAGNRALYDYLGLEFSLSPLETEIVFWNGASEGAVMPDADVMLDYLNENGIRTAVISNLLWSGEALKERFDRLLPNNKFEFVMTSSDYFIRKPQKLLFEIALKKAGLNAEDVWYCGDTPEADVMGPSQVGIFPVWYENNTGREGREPKNVVSPECEHLHIHEWKELTDILEKLK